MNVVELAIKRSAALTLQAEIKCVIRELKVTIEDTKLQAMLQGAGDGKNDAARKRNMQEHLLSLPYYTEAMHQLSIQQNALDTATATVDGLSGELWATIALLNSNDKPSGMEEINGF